ncbi:hypothetical protein [Micromonospora aurantiaca (nom. illeg.)]|uniref:hypothetical protein n=1 Tax=Micromonospora aurantiaca (nom. illeg.) TaxID=47850 RepID=UPI000828A3FA|nr:hypothetical protein [Micromonospora aurantiaca]SCL21310.1 hypothetical protein GA0070615_0040 [Micromonospora aurantiaca]SCL21442.1 hypothetical protein GA0070615_0074 [Micromonospora aurantiaca]
MGWINKALGTGRDLNRVETELAGLGPRDPRRATLSKEAARLQQRQTGEIAKALRNGADEQTVRFALELHGQGATRADVRGRPTPAQELQRLIDQQGIEKVTEALHRRTD